MLAVRLVLFKDNYGEGPVRAVGSHDRRTIILKVEQFQQQGGTFFRGGGPGLRSVLMSGSMPRLYDQ